jgi:hypothetical protein
MSKIEITELTPKELMLEAAAFTTQTPDKIPNIDFKKLYLSEHSPIRARLFWVKMYDIPSFVSTHIVRHGIGVQHYIKTGREDRGGLPPEETTRMSLVNHAMLINAQALINMSRKRLCNKAHARTRKVMWDIKIAMENLDPDLASVMVPDCIYRGNNCVELKSCRSKFAGNRKKYSLMVHPDFIKELERECENTSIGE